MEQPETKKSITLHPQRIQMMLFFQIWSWQMRLILSAGTLQRPAGCLLYTSVQLHIAAFARNVNGDAVRRFDRAAIKAQTSAVFDSNPGVRSKAAAVDPYLTPVVVNAAGTLRRKGSVCCAALVNGQVCRVVDKAAF